MWLVAVARVLVEVPGVGGEGSCLAGMAGAFA